MMNAICNTHIEDYLKLQRINWSVIGHRMQPGSNVFHDQINYVIRSINNDIAVLYNEVDDRTIIVPFNKCSLL